MRKRSPYIGKIIKVSMFSVIFLLLFVTVSYILRPYSGSASRKNLCGFYAEKKNSLEVVFVGSSSCFAFWEPMEFWQQYGITSYNFAAGTMPPQLISYCIEEVRKTQNPQLFVIDLRPFTVAEKGYYLDRSVKNMDHDVPLRNTIDNLKYSYNRWKMIRECVPDSYDKLSYDFDLIKYHTEWIRLFDRQSQEYISNASSDSSKGFKLVDKVKSVSFHDYSYITDERNLSERLEAVLQDLLDYCSEEELQVMFLVNTYCQSEKDKKTYNYIARRVTEKGFDFLNTNDYYQAIGLDFNTDYYDSSHTNVFGADKYTDFVGKYLVEHYKLKVQSDNSICIDWNQDYRIWSEEVSDVKAEILKKVEIQME